MNFFQQNRWALLILLPVCPNVFSQSVNAAVRAEEGAGPFIQARNFLGSLKTAFQQRKTEGQYPSGEERQRPFVSNVPAKLVQQILSEENPPPAIGKISEMSAKFPGRTPPTVDPDGTEKLTRRFRFEPDKKDSFNRMESMDVMIAAQWNDPEVQAAVRNLAKAVKTEDGEYYHIFIKHILQTYSPIKVLAIIHSTHFSENGDTLLHEMARVRSPEMIYELKSLVAAFLPVERKTNHFGAVRNFLVPKEFRAMVPTKRENQGQSLWETDTPVSAEDSPLIQVLVQMNQGEYQLKNYLWMRDALLNEPGVMTYLLALVYGNTKTEESLYNYYDKVMAGNVDPEINKIPAVEKNNWLRIFTLPLYRENEKGQTPLNIAERVFTQEGGSAAVRAVFVRAEESLGIDTSTRTKGKVRGRVAKWLREKRAEFFLVTATACLSAFQIAE